MRPRLEKKHYEEIALAMQLIRDQFSPTMYRRFVRAFSSALEDTNANYNEATFYEACFKGNPVIQKQEQ